ncbi:MAG: hypothetical protein K9K76_02965 [Halanaerobiales bacterium]|nr:hypothetical protein [Halanaerobiales bacterium]
MFNKKLKILSLTLVLLLLVVPAVLAQEDGDSENTSLVEEYDLDYLSEDEIASLEDALKDLEDNETVDEATINEMLEELELDEDGDEDEEDTDKESFGEDLSSSIAQYKEDHGDWTGQDLSDHIQEFLDKNKDRVRNRDQDQDQEEDSDGDLTATQAQNRNENAEKNKNKNENKGNSGNNGNSNGKK